MGFIKGSLPPGYHFRPSEKELIQCYLKPLILNELSMKSVNWFIFDKDIYQYSDPLVLFQDIQSNNQEAYFITPITKISRNGKKIKRTTREGTWHGQNDNFICDDAGANIGMDRMLTFKWNLKEGQKMSEVEREKGHWIMHEYSLLSDFYSHHSIKMDPEYVLCKIYCSRTGEAEPQQQQLQQQPAVQDPEVPQKRQRLNNGQPCAPSITTTPSPSMPDFDQDFTDDDLVILSSSDDVLPVLPVYAQNINTTAADNSYNYCNFADSLLEGSNDGVQLQEEERNLEELAYSRKAELEEERSNEPVSDSDHVKTVDVVLEGNLSNVASSTTTKPSPSMPYFDTDFTDDEWLIPDLDEIFFSGSNDEVLLQQEQCNLDYTLEAELEEESSNEPVSESDHVKTVDVVLDGNLSNVAFSSSLMTSDDPFDFALTHLTWSDDPFDCFKLDGVSSLGFCTA